MGTLAKIVEKKGYTTMTEITLKKSKDHTT